jgi:hypothetical protein
MIKIGFYAFTLTSFANFVKKNFSDFWKDPEISDLTPAYPFRGGTGVDRWGLTRNYTNLKFTQNQRAPYIVQVIVLLLHQFRIIGMRSIKGCHWVMTCYSIFYGKNSGQAFNIF